MDTSLQDLWVVVTRPADQASGLSTAIENSGGHAIAWPALHIQPIEPSAKTQQFLTKINTYDLIIFISINAVSYGLAALSENHKTLRGLNVYAVGKSTASALTQARVTNVHVPEIASSEGLLTMPDFTEASLQNKKVLIFRGQGGSDTLAKGLNLRGAKTVDYAEVYQRQAANSDPAIIEAHWHQKKLDIIIVTSIAGLDNLFAILGENNQQQLLSTPLLTVSDRVAKYAKQKGFTHQVLVASSAIDKDLITTLQSWHQVREQNE